MSKQQYRAYYDEETKYVLFFTGSGFPEGDNWIEISRELYFTNDWRFLKVNNRAIEKVEPVYKYYVKIKSGGNQYRVVKNNAGLLLEETDVFSNIEYYEQRNNRSG